MRPVDQTTFGVPGGNCFSACVASLLSLPIDEVPYFMGADDWFAYFEDWLGSRGHYPLCFHVAQYTPPGLHILSGRSPRGPHSVVARGAGTGLSGGALPLGNGVLLSHQIKLLAAFDHRHVFIDPSPDAERAFGERERLFRLPRSSWADYDATLISAPSSSRGSSEVTWKPRRTRSRKAARRASSATGVSRGT